MEQLFTTIKNTLTPQRMLLIFGVAFLFLYSWLYLSTPAIFNSPDETSTYVFSQYFAQSGTFVIPFEPNPSNIIRPRSVNISGINFVPGGFIGFPLLLGSISAFTGQTLMLLIPALIAVIAVIASYYIFTKVFSQRIAFYATLLMYFFPAWWHYAAKGLLPNTIFLSLLIISFCTFLLGHEKWKQKRAIDLFFFLSGFTGALALIIRPNEVWWVAMVATILAFVYRKQIKWGRVLISFIPLILVFITLFYYQSQVYGDIFTTGYDQLQSEESRSLVSIAYSSVFPFGIHLLQVGKSLLQFLVQLFWWHTALLLIGLGYWMKNPLKSNEQKIYTGVFFGVSLYLFLYYGSWEIADDLDASRISLGVSYIRYWLPYFILSLPFTIIGFQFLQQRIVKKKIAFSVLFAFFLMTQAIYVYQGKDGLRKIQQTVVNYSQMQKQLVDETEPNAIIVGERIDKIIWPHRQVIHYQDQDFSFLSELPLVLEHYPVYWLTLLPSDHVHVWSETVFAEQSLQVKPIEFSENGYSLYKIEYDDNFSL